MARRGWIRAGGVVAVTTAVAVIVPGTAYAGGPGSWTALSSYPASGYPRMGNIDAPTVLRGATAVDAELAGAGRPAVRASGHCLTGPSTGAGLACACQSGRAGRRPAPLGLLVGVSGGRPDHLLRAETTATVRDELTRSA